MADRRIELPDGNRKARVAKEELERFVVVLKLGFLVNPIAGMGGAVGLKGTDGTATLKEAIKRGAKPTSPSRAKEFLENLRNTNESFDLVSAPGVMGGNVARAVGCESKVIGRIGKKTKSGDTVRIARLMKKNRADLLAFCGGDGTARDILDAVGEETTVLGIPAGVKVYSSVFAISPSTAAESVRLFFRGDLSTRLREVIDVDEDVYRENRLSVRLYGHMRTLYASPLVQDPKTPSLVSEAADLEAIADYVKEEMKPDVNYLLGPGTTVEKVGLRLGLKKTLLGVDVVRGDGNVLGIDVNEEMLLRLVRKGPVKVIVSPIGGTGFLFGRGNQQISPKVLRRIGVDNVIVVASRSKLDRLVPRRLLVDTGDEALDNALRGYRRVVTGYREEMIVKVE